MRATAIFHLGAVSGPAKTLRPRLEWLAERSELEAIFPDQGGAVELVKPFASTTVLRYEPLAFPGGPAGIPQLLARRRAEVRVFRAHLRRRRPDLVVIVTAMLPAVLLAARLERIPAIVYAAELLRRSRSPVYSLAARSLTAVTRRLATHLVACSETVAAQYGHGGTPVTTIYPGVDRPSFETSQAAARRSLGVPAGAFCVSTIGSISNGRGQDVLLRALPAIAAGVGRPVQCVLAGEPHARPADRAYRDELVALASELGVADRVQLVGVVDPIDDVYAATDVVVNPARIPEGFGRTGIEALVAGRPVVASGAGALPEVLRHDRDALLVTPDRPDELAAAVVRLASDQALVERLVSQGRRRVLERFDQRRGVEAFAEVVRSVVTLRE